MVTLSNELLENIFINFVKKNFWSNSSFELRKLILKILVQGGPEQQTDLLIQLFCFQFHVNVVFRGVVEEVGSVFP